MYTQNIQQYQKFIQGFSTLFDEIKKEDDPIYNARVDFNTVKFLTEHADWNWDEDENKNKAYEVILQECDKTARQELEDKAKEELNKYITNANNINDDVKDKKVSIYGNHASITLEDNKKEFKISEFLNSDFCQKNGISGFSTLHSDGKSGMHGFVAEEGGKKTRHYVVTDGSYEMTLKWYAEGKECEIKIKIDANGVELVKGDDFSLERLEANRDVKIGGLFLHEIEFREKRQGREQESKQLSETFIESNSKNIGIQTHRTLQSNSRRQSYDSGIGKDFDDKINSQEAEEKRELRQAARKANSGDQVYNLQSLFEENSQNKRTPPPLPPRTSSLKKDVYDEQKPENPRLDRNEQTPNGQQQKRTPPPPPLRTSSLPPKENVVNEQGRNASAKPVSQDSGQIDKQNNPTPNNQQKGATSDPSDGSTFTKSVSHNQDNRQRDERYDNPTFGYAVPGSRKPDRSEQIPNDQQQPKTQQQEGNSKGDLLQDIRNFKKNNLRHIGVDDRKASIAGSRKNNPSPLETLKSRIPYSPSPDPDMYNSDNQSASGAEWKEREQLFSVPKPNSKSDSGYSPKIHTQPQVDPEQPNRSLENIEQSDQTPPENLLKEIRDRSQQDNRGLRQVDPTDKLPQDKEDGLQKDDLADVKTVEGPTVSVSASTPNSISDSGYSSPTHANHEQSRVNSGQLKASLMNFEQRDDTLLTEFISKLDKKTQKFPLKPVDQKGISEQTKEHLLAAGLLKDSSTDVKTNDSGYSSPTYTNHYNFQVSPEQLGKRLETIESKKEDTLEKLNKGLKEPSQQATKTKDLFLDSMLEKIKEGKQYDPVRKLLERKVAERENNDTNPTVDKNSELYKLLEKDEAQLKIGVIKEERKDTLTEHTDSYDRNRIALGNRNKRPLGWAKRIAESQEKDTNKSILM